MPLYYLYTRSAGNSNWTYSGYQLNVAGSQNGSGANGLQVMARTYPRTTPPTPPGNWDTLSGVSRSGNGTPNSPQDGDELDLPATIGTVSITGEGTYETSGDKGAGYYTDQGPVEEEGDWCAGSN